MRQIGGEDLYFDQLSLLLVRGEQQTKIDPNTAKLLACFLDEPNTVLSRKDLTERLWDTSHVSDDALNRSVSVLRKALAGEHGQYITTVPKIGYRFNLPEPQIEAAKNDGAAQHKPRFWVLGIVAVLLALMAMVTIVVLQWPPQQHSSPAVKVEDKQPLSSKTFNIMVLPFVAKSDDPQLQLFAAELNDEVVNRLTRIPDLTVIAGSDSKQWLDKSKVQHVLQGKVKKIDNRMKIAAQLTEANSGVYLFSNHFEGVLNSDLTIEADIAAQIAAAVKLSLLHGNPHYLTALQQLDHIGVEQLVTARANIVENTRSSLKQGLDGLTSLNQRYPDTPEVLGSLATAHWKLFNVGTAPENSQPQQAVKLANKALALDPTNFDALIVLYYHNFFVKLNGQAYAITEKMLRHHPSKSHSYRARLHWLVYNSSPCEEIQAFIGSIPAGVFTSYRLSIINHILNACLRSLPLEEGLNTLYSSNKPNVELAKIKRAISNNVYLFGLRHDIIYDAVEFRVNRKPKASTLSYYFWLQSISGSFEDASITAELIEQAGYWRWLLTLFQTLYEQGVSQKVVADPAFISRLKRSGASHLFAAVIILQAKQNAEQHILQDHLDNMEPFSLNLANKDETIALMMLQYHRNQQQISQQTAKKLFAKLQFYLQNHRQSFQFYGLGSYYLLAKFHCGESCQLVGNGTLEDVFQKLFRSDYAWWTDDIGFLQVALSPWANDPLVVEYLARIEQDRQRFRSQYGY